MQQFGISHKKKFRAKNANNQLQLDSQGRGVLKNRSNLKYIKYLPIQWKPWLQLNLLLGGFMSPLEVVQKIGNEVCEGCGPDRDCEFEYDDCSRIQYAIGLLEDYSGKETSQQLNAVESESVARCKHSYQDMPVCVHCGHVL